MGVHLLIKYLFLNISYIITKLIPKRKTLWVFGSTNGEFFRDNAKYLFLYVSNNIKSIKAVWISKDECLIDEIRDYGFNAHHKWSLKGMWITVRAKFVFYDMSPNSINRYLANGITFQLWHGLPMKKLGYDLKGKRETKMYNLITSSGLKRLFYKFLIPYVFRQEDWIVTSSPAFQKIMSSAFNIDKSKVLDTGYSRNDCFKISRWGEEIDMDLDNAIRITSAKYQGKKIILYMPTFRPKADKKFQELFNIRRLNRIMKECNALLILKHHIGSETVSILHHRLSNIIIYDSYSDAQPILRDVDLLITDYSGAFFDFLLLDKPIIFYPYDLEEYREKIGFNFDYNDIIQCGFVAVTMNELIAMIKSSLKLDPNIHTINRLKMKKQFFSHPDFDSSERLVNWIFKKYNLKGDKR